MPASVGVGLVVTDVYHGFVGIETAAAAEREHAPVVGAVVAPVERRLPAELLHRVPAVGEPQLGPVVAVVVNELEPFARAHESVGDSHRLEVHDVTRALVVEGEAGSVVTDLRVGAVHRREVQLGPLRRLVLGLEVRRVGRVAVENVLDVHQQQLLVLLLVVEAERDQPGFFGVTGVDQCVHRVVDMGAVPRDVGDGRSRQQSALRTRMPGPDGFVVRVEEVRVRGVERLVVSAETFCVR